MNPEQNAAKCSPESQPIITHQLQGFVQLGSRMTDSLASSKNGVNVDLFFIPLHDISVAKTSLAESWLSEDELAKVARYRDPKAQMKGLQVRAALRAVLSHYADLSPQDWCFEYGAKGKPSLTTALRQQTGLEFNLSHSGDWLLIGVAQFHGVESGLFGVDIERSRPKTDIYPILNHYFSPQETSALLALADEAGQRQRFFDLWALKESYIKSTGLGLAQSLKSFAFELKPFEQLAVESLELSCQDTALRQSCGVAERLNVYPHISLQVPLQIPIHTLDLADPMHWQAHFGRLTEEYRFAISLAHSGNAALPITLTAQLSSIEVLLADY